MCGICGIASFNKSDLNLANKVNLMTKNLNHRGLILIQHLKTHLVILDCETKNN